MRGTAVRRNIEVNVDDMGAAVGIADSAQHAFDDVDVMLSAIQVAHAYR